ncbi:MAG: hypothetical protein ACK4N5_16760 [Myxococcales bacterium]
MHLRLAIVAALAALLGCAESQPPPNVPDVGHHAVHDAGAGDDAGLLADAGSSDAGEQDAGSADAGPDPDAGLEPDAGLLADAGMVAQPMPDFSLPDINPHSPSHGARVSPRQHLQRVSAWYFGHTS